VLLVVGSSSRRLSLNLSECLKQRSREERIPWSRGSMKDDHAACILVSR
jgi:hypothetical protein